MQPLLLLPLLGLALGQAIPSSAKGLDGFWRESGGSVLQVEPCGSDICLSIALVQPGAPSVFDIHNPDPSRHTQPLCGMVIGKNFQRLSETHADGGTLYDPKTGKTYHGELTAEGDTLYLRGYIGIKAFGRTDTWTRTSATSCAAK